MKQGKRPVFVRVEMITQVERVVWMDDDVRDPLAVQAVAEKFIMSEPPEKRLGPGSHAVQWKVGTSTPV